MRITSFGDTGARRAAKFYKAMGWSISKIEKTDDGYVFFASK